MTRRSAAWLAAILVVASALRVVGLGRPSVWEDEVVSIGLARQPGPSALLARLRVVDATRAPLHPLLLQGWIGLWGDSVAAERALSAVCGIAAVALVFGIGRRAFGETAGRLGAWLQALNPLDVYHSREARMYELLVLLTCACWWLLLCFRTSAGRGRQVAYLACSIALVYTHPLGALMAVALTLGYASIRTDSKLSPAAWARIQVALLLAFAPWAPRYLDHGPESLVAPLGWRSLGEWPEAFTGGRSEAVFLGGALVVSGLIAGLRSERGATRALAAWFAVPVALLAAYAATRHPIFGPRRYLLFVGPAYLILMARGVVSLPIWPRRGVIALVTTVAAMAALRAREPNRPDWPAVAAIIRREAPGSTVFVEDDRANQSACLAFYLGSGSNVLPARRSDEVLARHPPSFWRAIGKVREGRAPGPPPARYRAGAFRQLDRVRLEYWKTEGD